MSTPQEWWDACLIKTWREHKQLFHTLRMFEAITGKDVSSYDPPLKRTPNIGIPWKCTVRHFVAAHLPKISERLWEQPVERDVDLLKKLSTSNYTTLKQALPMDRERAAAGRDAKKNMSIATLDRALFLNRNSPTDGNVVKGRVRIGRMK